MGSSLPEMAEAAGEIAKLVDPTIVLEASSHLVDEGAKLARQGRWILYVSRSWDSRAATACTLAAELKAEVISLESEPPRCKLALIPRLEKLVRRWVSLSDYLLHVNVAIAACSSSWLKKAPLAVRMSFRRLYAPAEARSYQVKATPQLKVLKLLHEAGLTPPSRKLAELASDILNTTWTPPPQAVEERGAVYYPEHMLHQVTLKQPPRLLRQLAEALSQERMYSEMQQLAYRMLELEMLPEARKLLAKLLNTLLSYQAKLTLAILEAKAGRQSIAEQLLAELAQQPAESEAKVLLAALLARRRELEEALELLEKAREHNPRRPDIPYYIGNIMQLKGEAEKAIEEYTASLSISLSSPAKWMRGVARAKLGKLTEAKADLEEALREEPTAEGYCDLATIALKLGNPSEAERVLTAAIALDPSCHRAYMTRGLARAKLGDLEGAYTDYKKAAELSNQPEAYANMALISTEIKQPTRALIDLIKALKLRRKLPDKGRCLEEAIENTCRRMLASRERKPSKAALAAEAMKILAETRGDLEEAEKWAKEAEKLTLKLKGREKGELYLRIAALNYAIGHRKKAEEAIKKAEATLPEAKNLANLVKKIAS